MTEIEITPCLLVMEFLYDFECILKPRKTDSFAGKLGKD